MDPHEAALLRRLEGIRDYVKKTHGWSMSTLCTKAGLSHSILATSISRLKGGTQHNFGSREMAALLATAGLSPEWAPPASVQPEERDPYPSRAAWFVMARAKELDEDVLAAVRTIVCTDGDPGIGHWPTAYREMKAAMRAIDDLKAEEPGEDPSTAEVLAKRKTRQRTPR